MSPDRNIGHSPAICNQAKLALYVLYTWCQDICVLCHSLFSQCPLPSFLYHPFTSCPSLLPSISSFKPCSPYCLTVPSIYTITSFCPSIPFIHSNFVLHRSIHPVLLFRLCLTPFHLSKLSANIFPPSHPLILPLHPTQIFSPCILFLNIFPPFSPSIQSLLSKTVSYASILHLEEAQNIGTFTHGKISIVLP
jgi:hypothetical protein